MNLSKLKEVSFGLTIKSQMSKAISALSSEAKNGSQHEMTLDEKRKYALKNGLNGFISAYTHRIRFF